MPPQSLGQTDKHSQILAQPKVEKSKLEKYNF